MHSSDGYSCTCLDHAVAVEAVTPEVVNCYFRPSPDTLAHLSMTKWAYGVEAGELRVSGLSKDHFVHLDQLHMPSELVYSQLSSCIWADLRMVHWSLLQQRLELRCKPFLVEAVRFKKNITISPHATYHERMLVEHKYKPHNELVS